MGAKDYNQHNLTRFKDHLKNFKAKDGFDNDCFMLARKVFSLYEQYPNATISKICNKIQKKIMNTK